MCHKLLRTLTYAILVLITAVSLSMAGTPGRVLSIDDKGMATVETVDGKMLRVKMAGAQVGDKVDCAEKAGKTSCQKAS